MSFDRDWWQFVRNGKQPPFRTLEEYKQWREEKEAAKSEVTGFRTPAAAAGAEMVADVTPIVGDAKGVADAYNDPSMVNIGAAIVGMIPIAGDMIAGGMKVGKAGTRLAPTGEALLSGVKNPARVFGFSGKGGRHLGDLMDMGGGVYRIHLDRGVASSIKNLPDAVNQIARTSVALLDDGVKQMSMTIPFGMDRGAFEGFRISASSLSPAPARIFFDESMNMVHLKYISE